MKQTYLFTKPKREFLKDEKSINAQLLIRAGFIDKLMAGVYYNNKYLADYFPEYKNLSREEGIDFKK